jgi:hypothetical protein
VDIVKSIQPSAGCASWRELNQFLKKEIYWPTQEPMPLARIKMLSLDASCWDPNNPGFVPNSAVSFFDGGQQYLKGQEEEIDSAIMSRMSGKRRKVILTSRGFFGVAPDSAKGDDQLCLLHGAEFPVLLRKSSKKEAEYEFIGECYIHGLMNGQGMGIASDGANLNRDTSSDNSWPWRLGGEQVPLVMEEIIIR